MHIHPLLESLASLETMCGEAVECLNVLAENSGPEFGRFERLQKLYGGDGNGGIRGAIRQLSGVVAHCLNVGQERKPYCFRVIRIDYRDVVDGDLVVTDEVYLRGSKPYEVNAANAVDAFIRLLDESLASLNRAISKGSGGGFVELICAEKEGRPLVDNAWQRLSDHWPEVTQRVEIPKGLDVSGFLDVIRAEIMAAKHLLTFGTPLPGTNGTTAKSEHVEPTSRRKGRKRKIDPKEAEILRVHQHGQSHADTAEIANVKTTDGRLDVQRVRRILRADSERKRRKRSTK